MNIAVLINQEHYKYFAKKLHKELSFDFLLICNPFSKNNESLDSIPTIYGYRQWRKFLKQQTNKEVNIITFDYVPMPIYLCVTLAKRIIPSSKINFVQHGIFEKKNKEEVFPIKTGSWFLMTAYFITVMLLVKKNFQYSYELVKCYAQEGAEKAVLLIKDYPLINNCFFWDEHSKERYELMELEKERFDKKYVIGSPDVVNFQYKKNGIVYYIGQPLYKTGHCTKEQYEYFLRNLIQKHENVQLSLKVILHPKIKKSELFSSDEFYYLNELDETIFTEKLIGHFSSLLIKASSELPIEQCDLGLKAIKNPNRMFYEDYLKNRLSNKTIFFAAIKEIISSTAK